MPQVLKRAALWVSTAALAATANLTVLDSAAYADTTFPVVKIKTNWGGGNPLNVGQLNGEYQDGAPALVYANNSYDTNSRWIRLSGEFDGWFMFLNVWSGKCLSATSIAENSPVVQVTCNHSDSRQRWKADATLGYLTGGYTPIRNKWAKQMAALLSTYEPVLSQKEARIGAPVVMQRWKHLGLTQYWSSPVPCGSTSQVGQASWSLPPQNC
ncbi:hypothetical protein ABZS94_28685 [Streptomyces sp. NPDC005500]|uniref:RICIN domain-containing protein n=1 Tax=Streptomyces sp. NPDC005500 TaxID=3155007 RepID=UPI0033AEDDF1